MKNGTVMLFKHDENSKGIWKIVGKSIVFFTGFPYTHVALYINEITYDYSVWKDGKKWKTGVRETKGLIKADEYYEPKIDLSDEEAFAIQYFCKHLGQYPYNVFKLLSLAIVYPLRKLFRFLDWVPFDNVMFGDVCSVLPDEAYKFAGHDLFPNELEGYTVPGMYTECEFFDKKEV